jgi:hypothetical protein
MDHKGELEIAETNANSRLTALRKAKPKAETVYTDLRELMLEEAASIAVSLTTALGKAETKAETLYKAVRELKRVKAEHEIMIATLLRRQKEFELQANAVQAAEESNYCDSYRVAAIRQQDRPWPTSTIQQRNSVGSKPRKHNVAWHLSPPPPTKLIGRKRYHQIMIPITVTLTRTNGRG